MGLTFLESSEGICLNYFCLEDANVTMCVPQRLESFGFAEILLALLRFELRNVTIVYDLKRNL